MINTGHPDIAMIHGTVSKAIDRSEGKAHQKQPRRTKATGVRSRRSRGGQQVTDHDRWLDRQPHSRGTPPTRPPTSPSAC